MPLIARLVETDVERHFFRESGHEPHPYGPSGREVQRGSSARRSQLHAGQAAFAVDEQAALAGDDARGPRVEAERRIADVSPLAIPRSCREP
jgi:hypothetical protein